MSYSESHNAAETTETFLVSCWPPPAEGFSSLPVRVDVLISPQCLRCAFVALPVMNISSLCYLASLCIPHLCGRISCTIVLHRKFRVSFFKFSPAKTVPAFYTCRILHVLSLRPAASDECLFVCLLRHEWATAIEIGVPKVVVCMQRSKLCSLRPQFSCARGILRQPEIAEEFHFPRSAIASASPFLTRF